MANKKIDDTEIAAAVLTAPTRTAAAEQLGISTRSLFDHMRRRSVQALLSDLRAERLRQQMQRLDDAQAAAVDTLRTIMQDADVAAGDRIRAARAVLEIGAAARAECAAADQAAQSKIYQIFTKTEEELTWP